jgi:predicted aminopeptidase
MKGMKKRFKIILITVLFATGLTVFYFHWAVYIFHLARHQAHSILSREKISYAQVDSENEKNKLLLIQKAKDFGKQLYGLNESKSFEYFVNLHRKSLGWNLTIAPALEMRAKEFYFPFVGKFGYLGFFDEAMKDNWKNNFMRLGDDVYENEIGAYSTLGYFKDPVYSTYLGFDDSQLLSLILHEMVHEKLYFNNDSDFSESMAVFMENAALNLYLYKQVDPPAEILAKYKTRVAEYNALEDVLAETKNRLDAIYNSNLPEYEKILAKKTEFDNLRKQLHDKRFSNLSYAKRISEMPDLNNAFLVQNSRYTPKHKNGFSLLLKDCKYNVTCWFNGLKKLEPCDKEIRKKFMVEEISLESILAKCEK